MTWDQLDVRQRILETLADDREQTRKRRAVLPLPTAARDHFLTLPRTPGDAILRRVVTRDGVLMREPVGSVKKAWSSARESAGLPRGFQAKQFRHYAGTWMAKQGVPLLQIDYMLGHAIPTTTRRYVYLSPEHLRVARDALDAWHRAIAGDAGTRQSDSSSGA